MTGPSTGTPWCRHALRPRPRSLHSSSQGWMHQWSLSGVDSISSLHMDNAARAKKEQKSAKA